MKQALGQLQATVCKMTAALEAIADTVLWTDGAGRVEWCNAAGTRLLRRPLAAILNAQLIDLLPLTQDGAFVSLSSYPTQRVLQDNYQTTDYEWQRVGARLVLEIAGICIEGVDGERSIVLIIRDVTLNRQQTTQHQQATALQQAEANYRAIFENATQGIFQTTPDGRCIAANPALATIMGYDSPTELMSTLTNYGEHIYVNPQRRQEFLRILSEQGVVSKLESQIYRKDGEIVWISETARAILDEAGQPRYYEGFVEDITERKRAESDRQCSERQREEYLSLLQATLEATADGILVINLARNAPVYNQKFLQMWSVPLELLLPNRGEERLQFLAHQTHDPEQFIARVFELSFQSPEQTALDYVQLKDGRVFERYTQPQRNAGQIIGRVWSFRDVTERDRSEAALRCGHALLQATFESVQDGVMATDCHGMVISHNHKFLEMWSLQPDMLVDPLQRLTYIASQLKEPADFIQRVQALYGTPVGETYDLQELKDSRIFERYSCPQKVGETIIGRVWSFRDITQRRQAEAALRQSEQKYRILFENSQVGIARSRIVDGVFIEANQRLAEILGVQSPDQLVGRFATEFYAHLSDRRRLMTELQEKGEVRNFEVQFHRQDGSTGWALLSINLSPEEGCVDSVVADVSDRKQAETALRQQQEFLRTVIDTDPSLIFVKDRNGTYLLANKAIADFYNTTVENLVGRKDADFHPNAEAVALFLSENRQVIETGQELFIPEEQIPRGDWLQWQKRPLLLPGDENYSVLGIGVNITARKQAEEALRLSEAKYRRLYENSQVGIFRTRLEDGLFLDVNQRFLAILGYETTEEVVGQLSAAKFYVHPEEHQQNLELILQQGYLDNYEVQGFRQGGSCIWVLCSSRWNIEENCLEGVMTDITARKQAEADLRVAKDAAEAANRAKSAFLANMSHELRTPLNAILGFAQLMERDAALTPQQHNALTIINRSGAHLLELINDVLAMSKIESGRISFNPSAFDLHNLLQTLHDMFLIRTQSKHLDLELLIAPDLPHYITTDEAKLRQVLINLLSNAVKFTYAGRVTLRAKRGLAGLDEIQPENMPLGDLGQTVPLCFAVEDTGQGIAAEEASQLFQPFGQTTSGTKATEGTGLGLAISRQYVQLMGGEIQFVSTVEQGTTFSLIIPVGLVTSTEVPHPSEQKRRVLHLAIGQVSYRILVVDDKADNRELLSQLLQQVGFETRVAGHGEEAIALWQIWQPDLIWMDMRMPIMDGYQATQWIRMEEGKVNSQNQQESNTCTQSKRRTKIIAITASAFDEQKEMILAAGCDDFVSKPFREDTIFAKIAKHLGVQYQYAMPEMPLTTLEQNTGFPGCLTRIEQMSPAWITALHQAAIEVDAEAIWQLIQQIPESQPDLATGLSALVRSYDFDRILELTESTR
jgi:two-component system sensor histidine kinase/response regulator